jgi:UrcA family protein
MNLKDPNPLRAARARTVALAVAAGAAGALLLSVTPARAETAASGPDEVEVHSETVHFDDLNLSSPKDAKRLYTRLRGAAETVCGDYDVRDFVDTREARKCENDAVAEAVAKVNQPLLTSVYDRSHHHA